MKYNEDSFLTPEELVAPFVNDLFEEGADASQTGENDSEGMDSVETDPDTEDPSDLGKTREYVPVGSAAGGSTSAQAGNAGGTSGHHRPERPSRPDRPAQPKGRRPETAGSAQKGAAGSSAAKPAPKPPVLEEDEDDEFDDFDRYQRFEEDDEDDIPVKKKRDKKKGTSASAGAYSSAGSESVDDFDDLDEKPEKPKKEKKKKRRRGPIRGLLHMIWVLFLILSIVISVEVVRVGLNVDHRDFRPGTLDGVKNILILGADSREPNGGSRSDAMILLSFVPAKHRIVAASLLRDTAVEIEGHGVTRLNHAYQFGGPELAVRTVEANYHVAIDDYILVDMLSIWRLIDAAGGSICDVEPGEAAYINGYLFELNQLTGSPYGTSYIDESTNARVLLDGRQAVSYGRIRYIGTDFARTDRQREVLGGMFRNVLSQILHLNVPELLRMYLEVPESCDCLTTSLSPLEFFLLFNSVTGIYFGTGDIVSQAVPIDGTWWNDNSTGQDLIGIDWEKNRNWLHGQLGQ